MSCVFLNDHPRQIFLFILIFSNTCITIFTTNQREKMSIHYVALGFEPTNFRTWVSFHNHQTMSCVCCAVTFTVQKTLFLQQCNCHAQVMRMCLKLGSKKIALFQFSFISSTKCSQLHAMENAFSAFLYATTSLMHDTSNKRKYTIMHIDILPLHNTTYATWYLK